MSTDINQGYLKVWDAEKLPAEYAKAINARSSCSDCWGEFYLPTEMVITSKKMVEPRTGRVWLTRFVLEDGKIVRMVKDKEYPICRRLVIVECYCNGGDDGHTNPMIWSYGLTTIGTAGKIKKLVADGIRRFSNQKRVSWKWSW